MGQGQSTTETEEAILSDKTKMKDRQLRELYQAVKYLKAQERCALAKLHEEHPGRLIGRIKEDTKTVASYDAIDQPFRGEKRKELPTLPDRPISADIKDTNEFTSLIAGSGRTFEVDGRPGFRYVDREIFPLRSTGAARTGRVSLDLLLATPDARPIACELKLRGDQPAYYALIQALMYAIELSGENQRRRLAKYYDTIELNPDDLRLDVMIMAFETEDGTYWPEMYESTKVISEKLIDEPAVSAVIRRISYVRATLDDGALIFSEDYSYP